MNLLGSLLALTAVVCVAALLLGLYLLKNHPGHTDLPVAGLFVLMSGLGFCLAVLVAALFALAFWFGEMFRPG